MNNIYFFHKFNNLLKTHSETHKNINNLIDDKIKYGSEDITEKENDILYRYKDLSVICSIIFDKISTLSNDIDKYLDENCQHNWTFDSIDIDPEHSTLIKYCINCNITKN